MNHIQKLVQRNHLSIISGNPVNQEPNPHPATTSSVAEHDAEGIAIIDRVFLRLAAIYGNAWRNAYKNNEFLQFTKREWLDGLAGYEEQLLYRAVAVSRENNKFPPSLPEFIECCKYIRNRDSFCYKREAVKPATAKVAEANLAKLKEILNMKRGEQKCCY